MRSPFSGRISGALKDRDVESVSVVVVSVMSGSSDMSDNAYSLEHMASQMLNHIPLGFILFDHSLNIKDMNISARTLFTEQGNLAELLQQAGPEDSPIQWCVELKDVLQADQPQVFDSFTFNFNGESRTLHAVCSPIRRDVQGELLGGIIVLEDITAIRSMERDLASAERLAAVGKLAARVAHELNNPLDGILRYINLALRVVENEGLDQAKQYLGESRKGLLRMIEIISELLEFSRSTFTSAEEADINKIIEDAVKVMESHALRHQVSIDRRYSPNMPNIRAGNLIQVFSNLIKNAIDAMPAGGELEIATQCDASHAIIALSDTGPGIPGAILDKLFEPFFSTKDQGKGTGLGLAICKDIVERFHGRIEARNNADRGATFTVRIPLECTSMPLSQRSIN